MKSGDPLINNISQNGYEGYDEYDPVHGFGWIRKINEDAIEGEIVFHDSNRSGFRAKRAKDYK